MHYVTIGLQGGVFYRPGFPLLRRALPLTMDYLCLFDLHTAMLPSPVLSFLFHLYMRYQGGGTYVAGLAHQQRG